ncbi:MAG: hypothetical protein ORN58_04935 [Sediminibacterium sp.]|nr:hypothetical protein [Sediminibacterium sp.]
MISIIALILYIINYKIFNSTLLNFNVFKIRTFRVTVIGSLFSRVGIGGIPFLLPLLFQLGFKYSPLISGLLVFPMAVAMFIMKFYVKPVLKLVGFKKSLMFNTLLLGISICSFSILDKSSNWCLIIGLVFINGIFSSMQFSCMNVLTYVDLEPQILSQGTSIGSSIQQLSMSFGVAFGAICLKYFLSFYKLENFNTVAFSYSFIVIGTFTIFTAFIFTLLKSSDGITASGYKKG